MKLRRTLVIGVLGALLAVAIERLSGWLAVRDADLCRLVGAVLTGRDTTATMLAGCAGQLIVAVISGYIYAFVFEHVFHRAGLPAGLLVGVAHVIVAGTAVGLMPAGQLVRAAIVPPGPFMVERGSIVVIGFLVAHLSFGAFVGATYGQTRRGARERPDER